MGPFQTRWQVRGCASVYTHVSRAGGEDGNRAEVGEWQVEGCRATGQRGAEPRERRGGWRAAGTEGGSPGLAAAVCPPLPGLGSSMLASLASGSATEVTLSGLTCPFSSYECAERGGQNEAKPDLCPSFVGGSGRRFVRILGECFENTTEL